MSNFSSAENPEASELYDSYRTLAKGAVFSICFGFLALSGFLFSMGAVFGLMGILAAIYALFSIKKYPDELTGSSLAKAGLVLSTVVFVSTSAMHTYIYLTEVPPDHIRMTFGDIKAAKYKKYQPSEKAMELDGKKVFIKGYTFPGKQKFNLSQFLLVGDFGSCCFGGDPEPSHLVRVSIKNGRKIDYSQRLRKLSGTFRVLDAPQRNNEGKGYLYEIDADVIK